MSARLLFFTAISPILLFSQKHDNVWMYGAASTLPIVKVTKIDFSNGAPEYVPTEFSGRFSLSTCSMSDSSGQLLFYTNGCELFDASGKTMTNGDTINGPVNNYWEDVCSEPATGYNGTHGAFALPTPNLKGKYYLFHVRVDLFKSITGFLTTQVDMNTPDGLGRATSKNVPLLPEGAYEFSAAVRHGNGRDWWVVVISKQGAEQRLIRFLLTPSGLEGPFEQTGVVGMTDSNFHGGWQLLQFTPDGKKMIQYNISYGFIVYDFDRCTGLISNPVPVLFKDDFQVWQGLDCEVSPSGKLFYIIAKDSRQVIQYDLEAPDIATSGDTVANYDGYKYNGNPTAFIAMQRGPDGKIYIAACCTFMHIIHQPDLRGPACMVEQRAIQLPTWNYYSLPYFPNYRLYDLSDSPCDTLSINGPVSAAHEPKLGDDGIHLAPNPASDYLSLESAYAPAQPLRLRFYDAQGRLVREQAYPHGVRSYTMDVSGLGAGCYFVEVEMEGGRRAVKRAVILR